MYVVCTHRICENVNVKYYIVNCPIYKAADEEYDMNMLYAYEYAILMNSFEVVTSIIIKVSKRKEAKQVKEFIACTLHLCDGQLHSDTSKLCIFHYWIRHHCMMNNVYCF